MATALETARFIVDLAQCDADNETGEQMTNLRLQKLLYFVQGWSIATRGKPFFDDKIVAWPFGPVVPTVYNVYRPCGRNFIQGDTAMNDYDMTTEEENFLIDILHEYYGDSTSILIEMTKKKDSPWFSKTIDQEITLDEMREYFSHQHRRTMTFDEMIASLPVKDYTT